MTLEDIMRHFKTTYKFQKITGLGASMLYFWNKKGFVSASAQILIEDITKGKLKANLKQQKEVYYKNKEQ